MAFPAQPAGTAGIGEKRGQIYFPREEGENKSVPFFPYIYIASYYNFVTSHRMCIFYTGVTFSNRHKGKL